MEARTDGRPRPGWLSKIAAANMAAFEALTPEERAEAKADKDARRARVEARRLANIERSRTIFSMFFDGWTDVEIGEAIKRESRAVRRFAQSLGFRIARSDIFVRRLVALSRDHELVLRALAERNGMTAAAALDLIVSVALRSEGMLARCILRNDEAVLGAVAHSFVTATYPPTGRSPEPIHVRD